MVASELVNPRGFTFAPDGALCVANFSVGDDNGEGQILRIDTNAAP